MTSSIGSFQCLVEMRINFAMAALILVVAIFGLRARNGWLRALAGTVIVALPLGYMLLRYEDRSSPPAVVQLAVEDHQSGFERAQVLQPKPADKSWVVNAGGSRLVRAADGSSFRFPGPRGELVGYSELEPTPDEALRKASDSLRQQIEALIRWNLIQAGHREAAASEVTRGRVEELLAKAGAEKEVYQDVVTLPESRAPVNRAAVLVRLADSTLQAAAKRVEGDYQAEQDRYRAEQARRRADRFDLGWTTLSAMLLALVIYLAYAFLNAGSKGHLAWPLRIVSLTAYLVLCAGLLYVRGHLQ